MVEQFKYVNHLSEEIQFGEAGMYVDENDIRDFAWDVISKNDKYTGFKRTTATKKLPIRIADEDPEIANNLRNRLFEVCEKDILAVSPGRLVLGDYYIKGYITESATSGFENRKTSVTNLTFETDNPFWIREETHVFGYGSVDGDLDYKNDFPYDYTSNILGKQLVNPGFVSSNFRMLIYGPAGSPAVTIGGHTYKVNTSVEDHEYLQIDSIEKTIELVKQNGERVNCFGSRDRDSYIFEKILSGTSNVALSSDFKVDITLLEERSEPKWI